MNKKEVIAAWYPLVTLVVNKMLQSDYRFLKQHRDDLISEGTLGLIKSLDTYEEGKGSSEVSYYSRGIRQAVMNYIRDYEGGTPRYISIDDIEIPMEETEAYVEPDFTLVDKYEPEDEIKKVIYHRILLGDDTYREVGNDLNLN